MTRTNEDRINKCDELVDFLDKQYGTNYANAIVDVTSVLVSLAHVLKVPSELLKTGIDLSYKGIKEREYDA